MPIPRYAYLSETRVEVDGAAAEFSDDEIRRAEDVAAEVAVEIGMKSDLDQDIELENEISASKLPPRRVLGAYSGTLRWGRPIRFRLEVSGDRRRLYYSILDHERGAPSPTVTRIRRAMMARVEAAFPHAAIVHEGQSLGPFFDTLLDAHHAVQPPSTAITAPVT